MQHKHSPTTLGSIDTSAGAGSTLCVGENKHACVDNYDRACLDIIVCSSCNTHTLPLLFSCLSPCLLTLLGESKSLQNSKEQLKHTQTYLSGYLCFSMVDLGVLGIRFDRELLWCVSDVWLNLRVLQSSWSARLHRISSVLTARGEGEIPVINPTTTRHLAEFPSDVGEWYGCVTTMPTQHSLLL